MGGMPLAEDSPAASIFSRRHARHRHPLYGASAAGVGMTCGNSAHQQPGAFLQVMGALHSEQRISTAKVWRDGRFRVQRRTI
jgi:hypothetical protein